LAEVGSLFDPRERRFLIFRILHPAIGCAKAHGRITCGSRSI